MRSLSSAEIERAFPFTTLIILRTDWLTRETLVVNTFVNGLGGPHRRGDFNAIRCYHFARQDHAEAMSAFILAGRYDRLLRDCGTGSSPDEVTAEWQRIEQERQVILRLGPTDEEAAGGRPGISLLPRRQGDASYKAHENASRVVAAADHRSPIR